MEKKKQQIFEIIQKLGLPMSLEEAKRHLGGLSDEELDEVLLNYQAAAGVTEGITAAGEPVVVSEEDLSAKLAESERREKKREKLDQRHDQEESAMVAELEKIGRESKDEFQKIEDDYRTVQEDLLVTVKKAAEE